MTSLFFLLGVLYFLYEFAVFISPQKEIDMITKLSSKEYLENKEKPKGEALSGCLFVLVHLTYLVWTFVGLAFSSQWISFLILVCMGLISGAFSNIFKRLKLENSIFRKGIKIIDALICAIIIADIFLVHFNNIPGLVATVITWF